MSVCHCEEMKQARLWEALSHLGRTHRSPWRWDMSTRPPCRTGPDVTPESPWLRTHRWSSPGLRRHVPLTLQVHVQVQDSFTKWLLSRTPLPNASDSASPCLSHRLSKSMTPDSITLCPWLGKSKSMTRSPNATDSASPSLSRRLSKSMTPDSVPMCPWVSKSKSKSRTPSPNASDSASPSPSRRRSKSMIHDSVTMCHWLDKSKSSPGLHCLMPLTHIFHCLSKSRTQDSSPKTLRSPGLQVSVVPQQVHDSRLISNWSKKPKTPFPCVPDSANPNPSLKTLPRRLREVHGQMSPQQVHYSRHSEPLTITRCQSLQLLRSYKLCQVSQGHPTSHQFPVKGRHSHWRNSARR